MMVEFRVGEWEVGVVRVVGEVTRCGWGGMFDEVGGSTKSLESMGVFSFFIPAMELGGHAGHIEVALPPECLEGCREGVS